MLLKVNHLTMIRIVILSLLTPKQSAVSSRVFNNTHYYYMPISLCPWGSNTILVARVQIFFPCMITNCILSCMITICILSSGLWSV